MKDLTRFNPQELSARKIGEALDLVRTTPATTEWLPAQPPSPTTTMSVKPLGPQFITCLSFCSLTGRPYVSHYASDGASNYYYSRSGALTREMELSLKDQRRNLMKYKVDRSGTETCPHCGTSDQGFVFCNNCQIEMCYGGVVDNTYFRCVKCNTFLRISVRVHGSWGVAL